MKRDYLSGVQDSVSVDKLIPALRDPNLFKHLKTIVFYNTCMYVIPYTLFGNILPTIINVIATVVHIVKYFDLVNAMKSYNTSSAKVYSVEELLSIALLMLTYQLVVQVIVYVIGMIFWPFAIPVLLFYHAFYCFNNLWQCQGIPVTTRLKRLETQWPYYLGYSTIATILYVFSDHLIVSFLYNIVFGVNICLVYLIEPHKSEETYMPINLSIFGYLTRLVVRTVTRFIRG